MLRDGSDDTDTRDVVFDARLERSGISDQATT